MGLRAPTFEALTAVNNRVKELSRLNAKGSGLMCRPSASYFDNSCSSFRAVREFPCCDAGASRTP